METATVSNILSVRSGEVLDNLSFSKPRTLLVVKGSACSLTGPIKECVLKAQVTRAGIQSH